MGSTITNRFFMPSQLYLCIARVTYDGWCRNGVDSETFSGGTGTDENSVTKCKRKCYRNMECVAFSYETPKDSSWFNCKLYKGGPYTHGNGRRNTTCYILQQGLCLSFCIYIVETKNNLKAPFRYIAYLYIVFL